MEVSIVVSLWNKSYYTDYRSKSKNMQINVLTTSSWTSLFIILSNKTICYERKFCSIDRYKSLSSWNSCVIRGHVEYMWFRREIEHLPLCITQWCVDLRTSVIWLLMACWIRVMQTLLKDHEETLIPVSDHLSFLAVISARNAQDVLFPVNYFITRDSEK